MPRIAAVRVLLALLGIVFLLANPAGLCAGMSGAQGPSSSHPCCPKPAADLADSPCLCIDRQPAAPTLPGPAEQAPLAVLEPIPDLAAEIPAQSPETCLSEDVPFAPQAIILSIHQLLL